VLDLGCGKGATSVFLARECDVDIVAFDLWIDEDELRATMQAQGVDGRVTVVNGDARDLPFQDGEFDAIVSVDAFEYFGTDIRFLPSLLRVLRAGGSIGMTTPALRPDPYEKAPPTYVTDLVNWEVAGWHAPEWWSTHWRLTGMLDDVNARMQDGGREDWLLWSQASEREAKLRHMLASASDDELGFAIVTATKR
jgi:cyclopropane fatty-acyl-phospholipid synthase-like methyltransferase